jgi:hypothetical protein
VNHDIFKTKQAGFFGQKPISRAALRSWMSDIEKRVAKIEKALAKPIRKPSKQMKLPSRKVLPKQP